MRSARFVPTPLHPLCDSARDTLRVTLGVWAALIGLAAPITAHAAAPIDALRDQVFNTETAFAQTMADRDHAKFQTFLAPDTVWTGGRGALRGSAAVAAGWKKFFDGPRAPFSWKPDTVEVLDDGTLAMSSGPVFDPDGQRVGTFMSVWRRERDGSWKIIFDRGCPDCSPPSAPPTPEPAAPPAVAPRP